MEVSRILRVLITLLLVVTFIIVTIAAYRQNSEINSMTTLSDSTSSIMTRLVTQDLVWIDDEGNRHEYIIDLDKTDNLSYKRNLAGEEFEFQIRVTYLQDNSEHTEGPFGPEPPNNQMTCSLTAPITVLEDRKPSKLRVIAWYT